MRVTTGFIIAGLTALSLAGCARGPGHGFGEVAGVSFEAQLAPAPARDLGDGWALTDLGYRYRVDRLAVEAGELGLEQLPGSGTTTFDPADPPPGYTLCHGGHCHADDGALVPYEEIEAELAGGEASWTPVVVFPVGHPLDLAEGESLAWTTCEPSCLLPSGHLRRASLPLGAVELEATVWDDAEGTTEWTLALTADAGEGWTGPLDLPLDRDHDPVLTLDLLAAVDGPLLDGIDPAELQPGGGDLTLDEGTVADIVARLAAAEMDATVERNPFGNDE